MRMKPMPTKLSAIAVLGCLFLAAAPAWAHHAFATEFDINKPVKLQGKVTAMNGSIPTPGFTSM
jgi:hypothetical protein